MKTLPHCLEKSKTQTPSRVAINDRGTEITYSQLVRTSHHLACGLYKSGIKRGDKVGVWLPNIAAYLEVFLACAELGAIVVSLNTKFKSFEMADIVTRSGCSTLVLWPDFKNIPFMEILSEIPKDGLNALQSVVIYSENDDFTLSIPDCLADKDLILFDDLTKSDVYTLPDIAETDGLVVFTTSGTPGKPKFVLHTQYSVTVHAEEVAENFGYKDRECRLLQVNPLCGTFGLTQALAGFAGGGTVYCLPVFEPTEACGIMQNCAITDINGSDDMYAMLLDHTDEEKPFPQLMYAGYAAFNPALSDLVEAASLRGVSLMGLWGMSEVQAFVTHQDPADIAENRKRAGGRLLSKSAKIRITDPETGATLPFGTAGELEIKTPSQMFEYLDNELATLKTVTKDGYIKTGDLCVQEDETSFTFLSRMGDVLRLGGYLTDPAEIENCLAAMTGVSQAQVVGVQTAKGQRSYAFVVLENDQKPNEQGMLSYCRENLAGYKVPVAIECLSSFPTTQSANGVKIQRGKLREDAQKQIEAIGS